MNSEEVNCRDKKSILNFAYNTLDFIRNVNAKNDEKVFRLFVIMLTYTGLIATAICLISSSFSISMLELDGIILGSVSIVIMITLLIVFFLKYFPKRKGVMKNILDCFRKVNLYGDADIMILLTLSELILNEQSLNSRQAKIAVLIIITLILYVLVTIAMLVAFLF